MTDPPAGSCLYMQQYQKNHQSRKTLEQIKIKLGQFTKVSPVVEALLSSLADGRPSRWTLHASRRSDIRRGVEAPCCPLPLLLHQHHHSLPPHLRDGDHLSVALSHHLGIQETRLPTNMDH